ncbi:gliding motility-associated C-terminal domain-containing protein [Gramella sp. MT6]|uniref:gliding motility-associated C-terminal domain-containing protein n=1 Tax=Gramella sp. MT6 TaxID=2705471 RepID=UPI001C5D93BA|nr:gliding motility-associated C-terminal domain-containing protein [Gramella sp. MT6]QYA25369.1 gliding motility-associated C-terminal domain-containing protein [Gramella sp. MT6]
MQNFTFGRKGLNWFLFAFILFVGNLSASYAQNCPTLTSTSDNFCYLSRVSALDAYANDGGDGVEWYRNATPQPSETAIPDDEILETGIYYAGNNSGDCATRPAFEVTVDDLGPPESTFGNFYEPCEYSSSDVTTVAELKALINTTGTADDINVYDQSQEYGTVELNDTDVLVEGRSYFVGQDDSSTSCQYSSRLAIRYDPILATAPTAEPAQTFCETATVADLEASGINRWYSTDSSNPALDPSTPLVDGQTYYASQIVNRTNSSLPPCESQDRTAVTVVLTEGPDAGEDNIGTVCFPDVDETFSDDGEIRIYLLNLLGEDVPTDGTFSPTIEQLINQYAADDDGLGDFTTTYTIGSGDCQDSVDLTIRIIEETPANSGNFDDIPNVCPEEEPIDLTDLTNNDPEATMGGTFTGTGVIDNQFDPAVGVGEYEITYTVDETSAPCITGTDSTTFTVTVEEATVDPNVSRNLCVTEAETLISDFTALEAFLIDILTEAGVDSPDSDGFDAADLAEGQRLLNFIDSPSGSETFNFSYSDDFDSDLCSSGTVNIAITVNDLSDAEAGTIADQNVCVSDGMVDLSAFLSGDATTGGSFSGDNVADGMFDATVGPNSDGYEITYSVDDSADCVNPGTSDSTTFTIFVGEANAGEDGVAELSPSDAPVNLFDYLGGSPETGGTWSPGDGTFDPATDSPGEFEYTVTNGDCSDSAIVTVNFPSCNAGDDNVGVVCLSNLDSELSNDREVREYYLDLLDEGVDRNGTFNPTIEGIIDIYADDEDGLGDFTVTYTIESGECSDSVDLTIRVIEEGPANAGTFDNIENVCSNDEMISLTGLMNNDPDYSRGGTFSGEGVSDNMFDPSVGAGTFTITYFVDETAPCVIGEDSTTFTITVVDGPVSANLDRTLCITEAETLLNDETALQIFFNDLLTEAGVETFNPDGFGAEDLLESQRLLAFISDPSDSETFNFSYVDESEIDECSNGTVNIAITINDLRDAEAGTIANQNVCETDGMVDLSIFLGEDSITGGTFSGDNVADGMFDASVGPNEEGYDVTYTVDDSADCVTPGTVDSVTFTVFVNQGVDAGEPNSGDVCRANVDEIFPNNTTVRNYYLNLLSDGTPTDGTFSPSINDLTVQYRENPEQEEFTTIYTITNGVCSDSVELTINVYDSIPAEIGDIEDQTYCRNAEDVTLVDLLPADANPNGTFEGYEDGIFSPGMEGVGTFDITYTLTDDSPCTEGEASATFTITVTESAFAGMDMDLSVCTDAGTQNLFDFLSTDADTTGEFTLDGDVIADGMMDPANFAAGTYEVVYTVPEINECGDDTAIFNITVEEAPGAPTVEGNPFTFCAIDGATVADLSATGTNLTYYSDAELSTMVSAEDELETGSYYVTQRNDEGACESAAAEITVTVNDAATPTISNTTQEFCEFDDATIADLTAEVNETGDITWYDSADGDNALPEGTPLQDGTVYYATLFDVDSGCESSLRLAVTVSINDDCPITIPEAFSPNGDGFNDTFEIRNIRDKYPNFTLKIRNRFGDMVYQGNANTPDWDGFSSESSFGSGVLPVGAYFYYLDYNDGSTEPVRGTVYLSR